MVKSKPKGMYETQEKDAERGREIKDILLPLFK